MEFKELVGKSFRSIEEIKHRGVVTDLKFTTINDEVYTMHHHQDCCESVYIQDIIGDLQDLRNSIIVSAEESTNSDRDTKYAESYTYTFYHISSLIGTVTIRWYGESNGYYSESVDLCKQVLVKDNLRCEESIY